MRKFIIFIIAVCVLFLSMHACFSFTGENIPPCVDLKSRRKNLFVCCCFFCPVTNCTNYAKSGQIEVASESVKETSMRNDSAQSRNKVL